MSWLGAFVLTQLVEAPLYAWSLRRWSTSPAGERVVVALLPSALTHPLLWLAFPTLREHLSYGATVVVAEALVVAVEAFVIARFLGVHSRSLDSRSLDSRSLDSRSLDSRSLASPPIAPRPDPALHPVDDRPMTRTQRFGLALGMATVANMLSVAVGLACRAVFDWP